MASSTKIGGLLDELWKKSQEIDKLNAKVKVLEGEYTALEDKILKGFNKSDIDGASGKYCKVSVNRRTVPTIKDFKAFFNFVVRNRAMELLQHRINSTAWAERMEAGKKVPGVEPFEKVSLSMTKRK